MVDAINLEAKQIGKGIRLDDKKVFTAKNPAFITLNFQNKYTLSVAKPVQIWTWQSQ